MSKEITKAFILQQITDKFKLREFEENKFLFSETVIPIYNIGEHLLKREVCMSEKSITSAAGFVFFSVPMNEKWVVSAYNIIFMGAGAHKVSGVYLNRRGSPTIGDAIYYDLKEGQTVSYAVVPPNPVIVDHGDTINVLVDDYTSTANLRLYIDVTKEEIR